VFKEVVGVPYMLLILFVITGIVMSIKMIVHPTSGRHRRYVSLEDLYLLFFIYLTVLIGFGIIFTLFGVNGIDVLIENGTPIVGHFFVHLKTSMYFSAVTLLSVGYGDIAPIGIGRWIAVVEALIGYTLPAAFVVRTVIELDNR
jgi:potassium channel LctB